MTVFKLKRGLNIPIQGKPAQEISPARPVSSLALLGRDYPGLKPTLAVREGEEVKGGQLLFTDKKNPGVNFTAPGGGVIAAINRGPKRLFESIVIQLNGKEEERSFTVPQTTDDDSAIRALMLDSGLWTAFRSRPYGRVPSPGSKPHSIFVTAIDTLPLAPDPALIINQQQENFKRGLKLLQPLAPAIHLCLRTAAADYLTSLTNIKVHEFHGPHPAGLPSTHIHFIDPVGKDKTIWHIGYQDVIALGHLGRNGRLQNERIIAIAGPAARQPRLIRTRLGANIAELSQNEFSHAARVVSGSLLNGYAAMGKEAYLGRYHLQVCALRDDAGRGLLNWLRPGVNRYSCRGLFLSGFLPRREFAMSTAAWGGRRAIFPLGTYEQVMPLDIIPTALLKALANEDTEKAQELGCLELIEEDLALCSFVCPGKNNFGPMLRQVLNTIYDEG
ncbi:Na(+)-translocating NADH-quinone reductase subunit A [hydrothermal vent metagenome]|uniref:Na(+)-translocating NADH-quinone reductase subunit A n=1 Tax=hydrothermal vent metagenome TaxID=652676 RepID=A0A3B0VBB5_9ZZZZ